MRSARETTYLTRKGSDGIRRLYVRTNSIVVVSERQGKKEDYKKMAGVIADVTGELNEALLDQLTLK